MSIIYSFIYVKPKRIQWFRRNVLRLKEQLSVPVKTKWSCGIGESKLSRIEFLLIGILILFCNWDLGITHDFVWGGGGMYYLNLRVLKTKDTLGFF